MGIDLADTRKALADTEIEGKSLQGDVQITRTRFNVEQSNMKAAMDFTTLMANAIAEFMKGSNDPMLGIAARIRTA
jgi:hypothetical protein